MKKHKYYVIARECLYEVRPVAVHKGTVDSAFNVADRLKLEYDEGAYLNSQTEFAVYEVPFYES